jgi:hypothetical protein
MSALSMWLVVDYVHTLNNSGKLSLFAFDLCLVKYYVLSNIIIYDSVQSSLVK